MSTAANGRGGREVVGNALLDAVGVLLGVLWGAITLVALLSALGGLVDLLLVGVGRADAESLAVEVGDGTFGETSSLG